MIAACPKCAARYRIERERLEPEGIRVRCARCEAVFRVRPPAHEPAPRAQPPQSASALPAAAPHLDPASPADRERLLLLACPEVEAGKQLAHAVAGWGLQPVLVHDGVEAILAIQRMLPRAVVLDAALPKMFGFQVCELVKRNESLCSIQVVLVGAIHDRDRYRRAPTELYGADAYVERHELPDALREVLLGFGLSLPATRATSQPVQAAPQVQPPPAAPSPAPELPPAQVVSQPVQRAAPAAHALETAEPQPARAAGSASEEAERLARIIVSDIVLYNQEKFAAALSAGNVIQAMDAELAEGRDLFQQRIDPSVRETRDYLAEELLRVARQRGLK